MGGSLSCVAGFDVSGDVLVIDICNRLAQLHKLFASVRNAKETMGPIVGGTLAFAAFKFAYRQIVGNFRHPLRFEPTGEFNYGIP